MFSEHSAVLAAGQTTGAHAVPARAETAKVKYGSLLNPDRFTAGDLRRDTTRDTVPSPPPPAWGLHEQLHRDSPHRGVPKRKYLLPHSQVPSQGIEGGEAEFERPEHLPEGDYYELKETAKAQRQNYCSLSRLVPGYPEGCGQGGSLGRFILLLLVRKPHFLSPPEYGACSCVALHNVLFS